MLVEKFDEERAVPSYLTALLCIDRSIRLDLTERHHKKQVFYWLDQMYGVIMVNNTLGLTDSVVYTHLSK